MPSLCLSELFNIFSGRLAANNYYGSIISSYGMTNLFLAFQNHFQQPVTSGAATGFQPGGRARFFRNKSKEEGSKLKNKGTKLKKKEEN